MNTDILLFIQESFEAWYNKHVAEEGQVSIVINYSDTQKLSIPAIHTSHIEMQAISLEGGKAHTEQLVSLTENYNHGLMSETDEKESMARKLMMELYSYSY